MMSEKKSAIAGQSETAPPGRVRQIIHLDMDAFYAAVEMLDNPDLRGLPVIIGGLGPRGVVSTASYEARAFGVHSAMPIGRARALCPQGVYLRPRMERYQEISRRIMDIFHRYTPLVEPLSLDEAFLDVTGSQALFGSGPEIARRIKEEVRAETGLTVTAGVATQKHLAKIASAMNKPDGLTVAPPGRELEFLWPLGLDKLWGVGRVTMGKLEALGLRTIGDLAALERTFLEKRFGRAGAQLWDLANGHDHREVEPDQAPKSVGAEETYAVDLSAPEDIRRELLAQTLLATRRMRRKKLKCRTVTVKFRNPDFHTITRARSFPRSTNLRADIYEAVLAIYEKEAPTLGPMRLLGVSLSGLSGPGEDQPPSLPVQRGLFDDEPPSRPEDPKTRRLNQALDAIADRFGEDTLKPAALLNAGRSAKNSAS